MADATLRTLWQSRIDAGEISLDPAQAKAVDALQSFSDQLIPPAIPTKLGIPLFKKWLPTFTGGAGEDPTGFYLYGDVGRGKTMLMDLFYATTPIEKKRRVHFHAFMLDVHQRLHQFQQKQVDDILPGLARAMAKETKLLCFDEFHVNNIADAMILGRLFTALFEAGVVIVVTSNWAPDDLYKNSLQRDRFRPFIDLIKQRMMIHHLGGVVDHRYEQMRGWPVCFTPLGEESTRKLQGIFLQLTDNAEPEAMTLPVQGRDLHITHAAKGVGFFNFDELCGRPLGAADYLAIAQCLHTVLIDNVPILQAEKRDETLRFMTLIDALYESKTKLFFAAAVLPEQLAPSGEHAFAFQRTVSRLAEMGGETYRQLPHLS
jgi:cell division protein ZapE